MNLSETINVLRARWRVRVRRIDSEEIWPHMKKRHATPEEARTAFTFYASRSAAWLELGWPEMKHRIDALD